MSHSYINVLDKNVRLNVSGKHVKLSIFLKTFPPLFHVIDFVMIAFWDRNAILESRHDDPK